MTHLLYVLAWFCFSTDATPIVEYTKNVVYLEDEEIALLNIKEGLTLKTIGNENKTPYIQELEMHLEALEKGAPIILSTMLKSQKIDQ